MFTLKVATAVFVKALGNCHSLTWLVNSLTFFKVLKTARAKTILLVNAMFTVLNCLKNFRSGSESQR